MSELEKYGRFLIAQQADRSPITFNRIAEELVCLAFDIHTQCLVELHVLNDTAKFDESSRESFHQRALTAMELHGPYFCRIIDVGEHDGMCYYATSVNDGEFLRNYVERVSPMDVSQALSIIIQLIDAVIEIEGHARLLEGLRLSNLLVCRIDDSHVAMRILDIGLARPENPEPSPAVAAERKMAELSQILYYLLSGKRYGGKQPEQVNNLAGLPASLKVLLRQTLDGAIKSPEDGGICGPTTLRRYRTEMADAFSSVSQRISRSRGFRPMDVPPRLHPQSQLSQKFFGDIDLEEQLGERYELVEGRDSAFSPYARLVYDQIKEREALIQFLPSYLTLPIAHSTYAIKGMSQVNEQSHPHVIQCRGFWQQDELVCIAEEAHNGFALSFLLADRGNLDPPEVLILLRQLVEAYDEAVALDMLPKCLSLHSLEVHFPNESRLRVRDFRKRQVDVWPAFRLKLRCHAILDSSVRLPPWGRLQARGEPSPEWLAKCDFVGIAEELVLGEQPPPPMAPEATNSLPEHVVELRKFFEEQYRSIAADPADYSFADLIENLGTQLARLRPRESVEVVGTIVDGAIALADAATKKTAGSRRGVASGAPRPMTASNEESGVDGARDSELNPIARGLQGAPQPGEENAEEDAVSLGTIDDGDFDIGDSREADPSLPKNLPQGVNREEDEGSSTAPEKPARRKGWFFLR